MKNKTFVITDTIIMPPPIWELNDFHFDLQRFNDAVTYIDANGNKQTITDYTIIDSSLNAFTTVHLTGGTSSSDYIYNALTAGWYVVSGEVNINYINLLGEVHIILKDDATLNVNSSYVYAICTRSSSYNSDDSSLNIYGQENQSGTLNATATGATGNAIYISNTLNINGGKITATSTGNSSREASAIFASYSSSININGGSLTAKNENGYAVYLYGMTIGSNFNFEGDIYAEGSDISVAEGKHLLVDGVVYSGTLTAEQLNSFKGKTTKLLCEITLPEGVTVSGAEIINYDGKNYVELGETLTFTIAYNASNDDFAKITSIKIGDKIISGNYTVTGDITVTAADGYPKIGDITFNLEGNYYEIDEAQDLVDLANYVNNGHNCEGLTFKQTADEINMDGVNFTPISNSALATKLFKGTFNGNGKIISNLTINGETSYVGLFGYVQGGTIQNVNLENATIKGNRNYVGGIVGFNNGGKVENCTVSGEISGTGTNGKNIGGIVGYNNGTVKNNKVDAKVSGNSDIGGVVGKNNNGTVSGNYYHSNVADNYDGNTRVYKLTLPEGVEISGEPVTIGGTTYYKGGEVTLSAKTGYIFSGTTSDNISEDKTINGTITFDTANHYVLAKNTSMLATAENTTNYPDLIQVYEVTLPEGVEITSGIYVEDGGKIYAADEITLSSSKDLTDLTRDGNGNYTVKINSNVEFRFVYDIVFNDARTAVTVNSATGDFGVLENGAEKYANLYTITAAQSDSTIVGNAKNNRIIVAGGDENLLVGGLGKDSITFGNGSSGLVADFGIGATKDGTGQTFAKKVTQGATSTYTGYNRTDTASYFANVDYLKVQGTVTGVYFDNIASDDTDSKKDATFSVIVTYNDGTENNVIVLRDVVKKPVKTSSTGSEPVYQSNYVAASTFKIYDGAAGNSAISSSALKDLFIEASNFEDADLTSIVRSLNDKYTAWTPTEDEYGHTNSLVPTNFTSTINKFSNKNYT